MNELPLALCQMTVGVSKEKNLAKADDMVSRAAKDGARLVCLPEMFNCPYENSWFVRFAEIQDGPSCEALSQMARKNGVYLIGGSIPEKDQTGKIYNTSYCYDPRGELIGKHRKNFLFDIDMEGEFSFKESDTLSPGNKLTLLDSPWGKIGVAICFDLRFPELFRAMALEGAKLIVVPGAFSMSTGPYHWELSFKMRAVDNQVFMAGVAPARDEKGIFVSYANSVVTDPWGDVLGRLGTEEAILHQTLSLARLEKIRRDLPLLSIYQKKKAGGFLTEPQ